MPHRRWWSLAVVLIAAATLAAACAQPGTVSQTDSEAAASDPAPTSGPAAVTPAATAQPDPGGSTPVRTLPGPKPPRTPSDPMPGDLLVGRVTRGGTGPCYGMETDEGVVYALFGGNGVALAEGDTVMVWFEQLRVLVDCGPGRPVSIVKLEIVR